MKYKFFGKEIPPACAYCAHGRLSSDGETVLCEKKGVMALDYHCRRYVYDPLLRKPHPPAEQKNEYTAEDFKL